MGPGDDEVDENAWKPTLPQWVALFLITFCVLLALTLGGALAGG